MTKDEIAAVLAAHKAWRENKPNGKRANLRCADLESADLEGANLESADLRGADLRCAHLRDAYLEGADLRGADLRNADLSDAYLEGTNLRGANLRGANLDGAYLRGANLDGANLEGVYHVIALGQPNGWWAFAYLWEGAIWVRVGCRTKPLADGRVYWTGKDDRREVMAALDYAETIARLRRWEFK